MLSNEAKNNAPVWVRIGQGANAPLVPGIITDARPMDRDRTDVKGRAEGLKVLNSIVVITLRENVTPQNGLPATYYSERPEALIAITARETLIPAIDGDEKDPRNVVIGKLRSHIGDSFAPTKEHIEEQAAKYLAMPALA